MQDHTRRRGELPLLEELEISEREISRRKEFLKFQDDDIATVLGLNALAQKYADPVIEDLYKHFFAFEETRSFFQDPATLERVKTLQREYFLKLTEGEYGQEYVRNRLNIGAVHARINLDVKWYLGAYNFYIRAVADRLREAFPGDIDKVRSGFFSLMKLMFLDIGFAIDTYVYQRERTIRQQQESIRELSTPVLQVRDRLLVLPIIGVIDTQRAQQMTESLLSSIRENRAKVVVMDITGVAAVDTKVANHLIQTVAAARLMGATVIVTGLSADVAQTLVTLGIDLGDLNTVGDLQGGIEEAERMLGYRVSAAGEAPGSNYREQG